MLGQRRSTLAGLLGTPSGPFGPNAGTLGRRLTEGWSTELRLIDRLLAESPGDDVLPTIRAWRDRTEAFAARSPADPAVWTDKQGKRWDASEVLALLVDLEERIARWTGDSLPGNPHVRTDAAAAGDRGGASEADPPTGSLEGDRAPGALGATRATGESGEGPTGAKPRRAPPDTKERQP